MSESFVAADDTARTRVHVSSPTPKRGSASSQAALEPLADITNKPSPIRKVRAASTAESYVRVLRPAGAGAYTAKEEALLAMVVGQVRQPLT